MANFSRVALAEVGLVRDEGLLGTSADPEEIQIEAGLRPRRMEEYMAD